MRHADPQRSRPVPEGSRRRFIRRRPWQIKDFIVIYRGVERTHPLTVEATKVIQEGSRWEITGIKGTLWVSAEAFVYAMPEEMMVKHS